MFYVAVDEKLYVAVTERGANSYIGGDRAGKVACDTSVISNGPMRIWNGVENEEEVVPK